MVDDSPYPQDIIFFMVIMLFVGTLCYIGYNQNTDKTTINKLSSFTVKNNPNAERDYEHLVAYRPKTSYGDDFKTKKAIQKLNELNTFGKK